jgi:hypothetical protein
LTSESVLQGGMMLSSPQIGRSGQMTGARLFLGREPVETKRYTKAELYELRRVIVRHARSMPPGAARNEHRQLATSMRSLSTDTEWLAAHTVEEI